MIENENEKWVICDSKRIKINEVEMINDENKEEEVIRINKRSDKK